VRDFVQEWQNPGGFQNILRGIRVDIVGFVSVRVAVYICRCVDGRIGPFDGDAGGSPQGRETGQRPRAQEEDRETG
jgi:hypothetical protein